MERGSDADQERMLPPSHQAGTELEQRFPDPGLPAHVHRRSDTDPKAARRAERQVTGLFLLSVLGTVLVIAGVAAIPLDQPGYADTKWSTFVIGGGLAIALFCIGAGAIQWAKKLMPDDEQVEDRHPARSTDEQRAAAAAILREGGHDAGFPRRKMVFGSLGAALGAIALAPLALLRDLGPLPEQALRHTAWKQGVRLVRDPTGEPVKPEDVPIGGVVHILPEVPRPPDDQPGAAEEELSLNDQNKAATLLIRLPPDLVDSRSDPRGWGYNGLVAYSKICTHVGCPVGLYEQQTHHLLCPCHQSTFDVRDNCNVIFGPAARPLPQLAITVDPEGYLVARQDYQVPVGPSFWERG